MVFGKILAGILGALVAGIPGLFFGLVLGHLFDRGLGQVMGFGGVELGAVRQQFMDTTFGLMGYIAKADGRVSEEEVAHTERVFQQLALSDEQRQEAILLFKAGADPGFSPVDSVQAFLRVGGAHPALKQTLMLFLVVLAVVDSELHAGEREALQLIGGKLGYGAAQIDELLRMAMAQEQFHQQPGGTSRGPSLEDAYAALGVAPGISDAELKRAYRRLMSQNHPDKLSARGVPEEMLKLATEKSQEIQAAYELVRKARGSGRGD